MYLTEHINACKFNSYISIFMDDFLVIYNKLYNININIMVSVQFTTKKVERQTKRTLEKGKINVTRMDLRSKTISDESEREKRKWGRNRKIVGERERGGGGVIDLFTNFMQT